MKSEEGHRAVEFVTCACTLVHGNNNSKMSISSLNVELRSWSRLVEDSEWTCSSSETSRIVGSRSLGSERSSGVGPEWSKRPWCRGSMSRLLSESRLEGPCSWSRCERQLSLMCRLGLWSRLWSRLWSGLRPWLGSGSWWRGGRNESWSKLLWLLDRSLNRRGTGLGRSLNRSERCWWRPDSLMRHWSWWGSGSLLGHWSWWRRPSNELWRSSSCSKLWRSSCGNELRWWLSSQGSRGLWERSGDPVSHHGSWCGLDYLISFLLFFCFIFIDGGNKELVLLIWLHEVVVISREFIRSIRDKLQDYARIYFIRNRSGYPISRRTNLEKRFI